MTQCWIEDAEGPCHCDNCDWEGDASDLEMISDIEQRIGAGGIVPAGQCPECNALAYLDQPPAWARDTVKDEMVKALRWLLDEIGDPGKPKHPSCEAIAAAADALAKAGQP